MTVQCRCGRFLANAHATARPVGGGYGATVSLADVRGDCSRCGPGVQASREGWWWDWDAWTWPAGMDAI